VKVRFIDRLTKFDNFIQEGLEWYENFRRIPGKDDFTPIPNMLHQQLLPQIDDIAELKVTLYIMEAVYNKKAIPGSSASTSLRKCQPDMQFKRMTTAED
jgi:hypothetical protein